MKPTKKKKGKQTNRLKKLKEAQVHNKGLKNLSKELEEKQTEDILSEHFLDPDL